MFLLGIHRLKLEIMIAILNLESWILKLDFCQIGLIFSLAWHLWDFSLYLGIHPMYASNKSNFSILAVDSRYKHSGMTCL